MSTVQHQDQQPLTRLLEHLYSISICRSTVHEQDSPYLRLASLTVFWPEEPSPEPDEPVPTPAGVPLSVSEAADDEEVLEEEEDVEAVALPGLCRAYG